MKSTNAGDKSNRNALLRSIMMCIGTIMLLVFSCFAYLLVELLIDFFRTPEEVKLLSMIIGVFEGDDGILSFANGDSSGFDLQLSPAFMLLFGVLFVFMGISALGGLVSGGLGLGATMIMHAYKPKTGNTANEQQLEEDQ